MASRILFPKSRSKAVRGLFFLGTVLGLVIAAAQAQTLKTLLTFSGVTDGAYSSAGLTPDGHGNVYGTTQAGGTHNFAYGGTVFRMDRRGNETVIYSFCARTNCADGGVPYGGVILDASGNVYGAASYGGAYGFGVVFKIDSSGNESVLYSFKGLAQRDGASPAYGNLVRDGDGNLYGATLNGGLTCSNSTSGCGIIYKIDGLTGAETVLHRFTGGADGGLPPTDLIADANGRLYGTTFRGGSVGCGGVFEIGVNGAMRNIYDFDCNNTDGSNGGLIHDANGNLYGTTAFGGTWSRGTVFKVEAATGAATVLYNFVGGTVDGCAPGLSSLTLDEDGNLYGSTSFCGANGGGMIFKLDPAGQETVLYNFASGPDGNGPQTTLLRSAFGNLYGTAYFTGIFQCCGSVFRFTP